MKKLFILLALIPALLIGQIPGEPDASGTIQPGPPWVTGAVPGDGELKLQLDYLNSRSDSLQTGVLIVTNYGAIGDGVTDDTEAINNAISSAMTLAKPLYFPPATYLTTGLNTIAGDIEIIGVANRSIIKTVSNANMFLHTSGTFHMSGMKLQGSYTGTPLSNQRGIYLSHSNLGNDHKCVLQDVIIEGFAQSGIRTYRTKNNFVGGIMTNIVVRDCNIGIWFSESGEYFACNALSVYDNEIGIQIDAGNININGGYVNSNDIGFYITGTDPNNSHGIITGVTINHSDTNSLKVDGATKGMLFTGCAIWAGDMLFKDCTGIMLNGCSIDVNNITFDNTVKCEINHGYRFGTQNIIELNTPDYTITDWTEI